MENKIVGATSIILISSLFGFATSVYYSRGNLPNLLLIIGFIFIVLFSGYGVDRIYGGGSQ